MSSSVSKPFLLASYSLPKRLSTSPDASTIYATHSTTSTSSDGYVTVTAQGDGVHIFDLSSLHPVVSHTLGPSTTFSCPAVSRNTVEKGAHICTTYAVIASSPDVDSDDSGRTIWAWSDNLSASLDMASQKKTSVTVSHMVSRVHLCGDVDPRLFVLSPTGELTVMDADLNVQHCHPSPVDDASLLESFLFPCSSLSFLSTPSQGAVVVLLLRSGISIRMRIFSVTGEELTELGLSDLHISPDQVSTISCSASGHLSILMADGIWNSFLLSSADQNSITASALPEPVQLASLSFVSSPQLVRCQDEIAILSLGSSHVLLAGITSSSVPEIALLLWDLQYSVLLASNTLPIPSTLSYSKEHSIRPTLIPANASHALLVLCPVSRSSNAKSHAHTTSRSSVLVVPFMAPVKSTIANAMGRAADGLEWIAKDASSLKSSSSGLDHSRKELLQTMCNAMEQNRPAAASSAFFEWEKKLSGDANSDTIRPSMDYGFVKQILIIVLRPTKSTSSLYTSDVIRFLLQNKLVSASMVEGGLLEALRVHDDWKSMELAFEHVLDIQEGDIVSVLKPVILHHRTATLPETDAMQIDSENVDIPSLSRFLSMCVAHTTTPAELRLAIHEHLREGEDVVCLLEIMHGWISTWVSRDDLMAQTTVSKVPDLPSLNKILLFLQSTLDASLLCLLQHRPAHRILRKTLALLELELDHIEQMEVLRGPLEPFAKAAKVASEGGSGETQLDKRKKKRQAREQTALAVGLYRLEELIL